MERVGAAVRNDAPWWFRIYFAVMALLAITMIAAVVYGLLTLVSLGPSGIARILGEAYRAFVEASQ